MTEDDVIFLGASLLLGQMLARNPDAEPSREFREAVTYAYKLRTEVKRQHEQITNGMPLASIESYKVHSARS